MENEELHRTTSGITTITAIMLSVFFMGAGTALQTSAVSLRAGLEGFSDAVIGLMHSVYYAGLVVGSLLAPRVVREVGYVRSFAAFASIGSATAIAHVLLVNPAVWLLFRAATGSCLAVMLVVVESWLNSSSARRNRGRILSVYSVVYLGSMGAGQPLLGLFSAATFELFGAVSILVSFALIPVALMRVEGGPETAHQPAQLITTFRRSPLAGSGIVASGLITGATWSLTPRYAQAVGLAEGQIGILMLLVSLGTLTMQWPLGTLSDRRGRRRAILVSAGVACAAALLVVGPASDGTALFVAIFLFGGFGMPLYSLCIALANDQLTPAEMVGAAGAIVIYYGIGSAVGPFAASLVMAGIGPAGLFAFMAAGLGLLVLASALRMKVVPGIVRLKDSAYRMYPRTTATAFALLRRARRRRGQ